jgi:hypothetical protein
MDKLEEVIYNFIGAFDFEVVKEPSQNTDNTEKVGVA